MQTIKEVFCSCVIAAMALFLPATAALTGHVIVAILSVPMAILYIVIGCELLTEYSMKNWEGQ